MAASRNEATVVLWDPSRGNEAPTVKITARNFPTVEMQPPILIPWRGDAKPAATSHPVGLRSPGRLAEHRSRSGD